LRDFEECPNCTHRAISWTRSHCVTRVRVRDQLLPSSRINPWHNSAPIDFWSRCSVDDILTLPPQSPILSCTTVKMVGAPLRPYYLRIHPICSTRNEQKLTQSASRSATQPNISLRPNRLVAVAPTFESASRTPARPLRLSTAGSCSVQPNTSRM
jgi:hypothetical protein